MKITIDVCDRCGKQPADLYNTGNEPDFLYAMSCEHTYICDLCLDDKRNPFEGKCPFCGALTNLDIANLEIKKEKQGG